MESRRVHTGTGIHQTPGKYGERILYEYGFLADAIASLTESIRVFGPCNAEYGITTSLGHPELYAPRMLDVIVSIYKTRHHG